MSEFFNYESDDSCCGSFEYTQSKISDNTIKNRSPESIHNNKLEIPILDNSRVSKLVNTIDTKT